MTTFELMLLQLAIAYDALAHSLAGTPFEAYYAMLRDTMLAVLRSMGWMV